METIVYENSLPQNGPILNCPQNECNSFTESINEIKTYIKKENEIEILDKSLSWFAMETDRDFSELNGLNGYEIIEYINDIKRKRLKSR